MVSWIFISAIGWVVFFFMFRTEGALKPEKVVDELAAQELAEATRNQAHPARVDPADTALQGPLPPPEGSPPRTSEENRAEPS